MKDWEDLLKQDAARQTEANAHAEVERARLQSELVQHQAGIAEETERRRRILDNVTQNHAQWERDRKRELGADLVSYGIQKILSDVQRQFWTNKGKVTSAEDLLETASLSDGKRVTESVAGFQLTHDYIETETRQKFDHYSWGGEGDNVFVDVEVDVPKSASLSAGVGYFSFNPTTREYTRLSELDGGGSKIERVAQVPLYHSEMQLGLKALYVTTSTKSGNDSPDTDRYVFPLSNPSSQRLFAERLLTEGKSLGAMVSLGKPRPRR